MERYAFLIEPLALYADLVQFRQFRICDILVEQDLKSEKESKVVVQRSVVRHKDLVTPAIMKQYKQEDRNFFQAKVEFLRAMAMHGRCVQTRMSLMSLSTTIHQTREH